MPVDTEHTEYKNSLPDVTQVRDCFKGPRQVKSKNDTYLPKLDEQSETQYQAYKTRGYFLPAVKPASIALTGAIMRRDPMVSETRLVLLFGNEDQSLIEFATMSCMELFIAGKGGYLVEHNGTEPVLKFYNRESIINWGIDFVVLKQSFNAVNPKDEFEISSTVEYLELRIIEGVYTQRIWRTITKSKKLEVVKITIPTSRGEPLTEIPFVFFNTVTADNKSTPPALLEMSDINLDHYRLATDLRHGLHNTALPTMFVFGDIRDDEGEQVKLVVGPGSANHIPDSDGRAELLEFTGAGLGSINTTLKDDVEQMAAVGAKMFQDASLGVKAAETARIEQSGESATLSTIANSVESALTKAYNIGANWQGETEDIVVELNRDFLDVNLSPQDILALLSSVVQGNLSQDSFLFNLKKGERLPKDRTIEQEKELIANEDLGLA